MTNKEQIKSRYIMPNVKKMGKALEHAITATKPLVRSNPFKKIQTKNNESEHIHKNDIE